MEQVQMDTLCYQRFGMVFHLNPLLFFAFSNHTAHDLFCGRFRRLPTNMVRRLGKSRCHTHRERTRANPLNTGIHHWYPNLSYRLGRYSPQ